MPEPQKRIVPPAVREAMNDPANILVTPQQLPLLGITFGRTQLRKLWRRGEFPEPVRLSDRLVGWRLADVKAWIASRPQVSAAPVSYPPPPSRRRSGGRGRSKQ